MITAIRDTGKSGNGVETKIEANELFSLAGIQNKGARELWRRFYF